jgi:hypothetical protein
MTHRQARRKLGSRSIRRSGTNGKNVKVFGNGQPAPLGKGGRVAYKFRYPRRASRKVAVQVAALVKGA